jgi:Ca2+-transporting ATPase
MSIETSTTLEGLSTHQAETQRTRFGVNLITPPPRNPWWKLLLEKFDDPIIRILLIAALISIIVGIVHNEYYEGIGIIVAIILAVGLGFINEYKAGKEFDILNKVSDDVEVKVKRDGALTTIPRRDVVVGDICLVEAGEETPADGTLHEAISLKVDESKLTGESIAVTKVASSELNLIPAGNKAYAPNRVLRGTVVSEGYGTLEVIAVGDNTEIGKTARAASEETDEETPLNRQLDSLSKLIGVIGFSVAAIVFIALIVRGVIVQEIQLTGSQWYFFAVLFASAAIALIRVWVPIIYDGLEVAGKESEPPAWFEQEGLKPWLLALVAGAGLFGLSMLIGIQAGWLSSTPSQWFPYSVGQEILTYFMIAVTIIVVAVPEGLPMSVTLSLAYSMRKMMKSNNLVRRMHACETIGAVSVICSDKTGTLTKNEMHVAEIIAPSLPKDDSRLSDDSQASKLFVESIAANSSANLGKNADGSVQVLGNPTEGALLRFLEQNELDYLRLRKQFAMTSQLTFSTERKYMATAGFSQVLGSNVLYVKGAPEVILSRSSNIFTASGNASIEEYRADILSVLTDHQSRGYRTLALAYRLLEAESPKDLTEITDNLTWIGFVAIADPIREDVPQAISACQNAGIDVKIVTGDNSETAREIGRQIGLWKAGDPESAHLTGSEFEQLSDIEASQVATGIKILSRARPTHKMRLVQLLQGAGRVVAVTGDGVNDGPALNYANVGLAMGKSGTAVAKEASDIILLDDSFTSIANAVKWGRSLYDNIQRFILFQATVNVAALGIALIGPFIGVKLPLTVTQMLWINLIMDTFAALALATEPPHDNVMERAPRDPDAFIINRPMANSILIMGIIFLIVLLWLLLRMQNDGQVTTYELTYFFTFFVMLQFWNLFNARRFGLKGTALSGLIQNRGFIYIASVIFIGQIGIVQFGSTFFRTEPLTVKDWLIITVSTLPVVIISEIYYWIRGGSKT